MSPLHRFLAPARLVLRALALSAALVPITLPAPAFGQSTASRHLTRTEVAQFLTRIDSSYYNADSDTLLGFDVNVLPDWRLTLGGMDSSVPVRPLLSLLDSLHCSVVMDEGELHVNYTPADMASDYDAQLKSFRNSVAKVLLGALERWAFFAYMDFPFDRDTTASFERAGDTYTIIVRDTLSEVSDTFKIGADMQMQEISTVRPGVTTIMTPQFQPTADGYLLTSIIGTSVAPDRGIAVPFTIYYSYAVVEGELLPDSIRAVLPAQRAEMKWALDHYILRWEDQHSSDAGTGGG